MGRSKGSANITPGTVCTIDGCGKTASHRGWCTAHYTRWQRHGDPVGGAKPRRLRSVTAAPCSVDACPEPAHSEGMCVVHYARWKRHGNTDDPATTTTLERFWGKVQKTGFTTPDRPELGDCWVYTGAKVRGYGMFSVDNKSVSAHRWAYTQLVGPIPEDMTLDHLCYTRNCVRPDHLEPVSIGENVVRAHGRLHYVVIYGATVTPS